MNRRGGGGGGRGSIRRRGGQGSYLQVRVPYHNKYALSYGPPFLVVPSPCLLCFSWSLDNPLLGQIQGGR